MRIAILALALLAPGVAPGVAVAPASAQTSAPARSAIMPPNLIDRSTATSDRRAADARNAAEADRAAAAALARTAPSPPGPVPQSTFTDGVAGFGTPPADSPPAAPQ